MTADQLRAHLARLGLTQVGAARFFQMGERTMRRYCAGQAVIPMALAELLPKLSKAEVRRKMKDGSAL